MSVSPAETVSTAPDWMIQARELHCPLCGYNLRGLIEPTCPECGHRFNWAAMVRDADLHRFLFEHANRRRLVAFIKTWSASFLPRRFWRSVQPVHQPNVRRLSIYAGTLIALDLLIVASSIGWQIWLYDRQLQRYRANFIAQPWTPRGAIAQVKRIIPWEWSGALGWLYQKREWPDFVLDSFVPIAVTVLVWPWLTLASLHLFRVSLRAAQIKRGHVLRCAVYSADVTLLLGPLLLGMMIALLPNWSGTLSFLPYPYNHFSIAIEALTGLLLVWTYRLYLAYRTYLAFSHPLATVVASQVIVALIVMIAWMAWSGN